MSRDRDGSVLLKLAVILVAAAATVFGLVKLVNHLRGKKLSLTLACDDSNDECDCIECYGQEASASQVDDFEE